MTHKRPLTPLAHQVALITGANTGIGRVTAVELARAGAQVVIAGRSLERTQPVLDAIRALPHATPARFVPLDLGRLQSVRECAAAFTALGLPLHLLINNAGVAGARGLTHDGFEMMFGVNHLGHFLLTQELLPILIRTGASRVITVSSRAHRFASSFDWDALRRPTHSRTGVHEYAVSKLANLLFSAELARQLAGSGVSTYAVHPGVVATDIWRAVPAWLRPLLWLRGMRTPEQGARTSLHCALHAPASERGLYYADSQPKTPSAAGLNTDLARDLWQRSLAWVAGPA